VIEDKSVEIGADLQGWQFVALTGSRTPSPSLARLSLPKWFSEAVSRSDGEDRQEKPGAAVKMPRAA